MSTLKIVIQTIVMLTACGGVILTLMSGMDKSVNQRIDDHKEFVNSQILDLKQDIKEIKEDVKLLLKR